MVVVAEEDDRPQEYPERIPVGRGPRVQEYVLRRGEVVVQFIAGVEPPLETNRLIFEPDEWQELRQEDQCVPMLNDDDRRARRLRSAGMSWVRIPVDESIAGFEIRLREKYGGRIRRVSPVYAEVPDDGDDRQRRRSRQTAVIPLLDRIVVRVGSSAVSEQLREIALQHNIGVRDVVHELIDDSRVDTPSYDFQERIDRLLDDTDGRLSSLFVLTPPDETMDTIGLFDELRAALADSAGVDFDWRRIDSWNAYAPAELGVKEFDFSTLKSIGALDAWQIEQGDDDVIVALLDSGFALNHSELSDAFVDASLHFDAETWADLNGPRDGEYYSAEATNDEHGTLVAGIVAARHDGVGALGLAPGCAIMPIKLGLIPSALEIGAGLLWACVHGAKVANLSLETAPIDADDSVISLVWGAGLVIVAATGNDGAADGVAYPASHPNVIAVGASADGMARYDDLVNGGWSSQFGPELSVIAPGIGCTTTVPPNAADSTFEGTSAAAPYVTALAALLFSRNPNLPNGLVREAILSTCDFPVALKAQQNPAVDAIPRDWHEEVGYGHINARAALDFVGRLTPGRIKTWKDMHPMAVESAKQQARNRLKNLLDGQALYTDEEQQDIDIIHAANREGSGLRVLEGFAFVALRADGNAYEPLDVAAAAARVRNLRAAGAEPALLAAARNELAAARDRARDAAEAAVAGGRPAGAPARPYKHIRLYLDAAGMSWVDVRADDVRVLRRYAKEQAPLGRIFMLVNANAQLRFGRNESVDEFLQGAIVQDMGGDDDLSSVIDVLRSLGRTGGLGGYSTARGPCSIGGYSTARGPCSIGGYSTARGPC